VAKIHRLSSPFEHWISGLLVELLAFTGYIAVIAGVLVVTILLVKAL
jgi:hypothetical protein